MLLPCLIFGITRTVSLDGTQDYTSIQAAIDDSYQFDVILVYPGRYVENIVNNRYSIRIESLYSIDPQEHYIENTIIDGNLHTCVEVRNAKTLSLNGFTLTNNEGGNFCDNPRFAGGGLDVHDSSTANVSNCIIRDSFALSGGGIAVGSASNLSLSNVKIFNNQALSYGGGVFFTQSDNFVFDPDALCSIYDNTAARGMDISFYSYYETQYHCDIYLQRGSVVLSEPDGYFIGVRGYAVTVDIQEGHIPQIDSDLYISADGSDANTGLTPESPMRSIVYAMQRIAVNPANPRTIHLAEGVYTNMGQSFPAGVKSHIRIIGAGPDATVLDCGFTRTALEAWYVSDLEIANLKIINCRSQCTWPLGVYEGSDIYLHDLKFENNHGLGYSGIVVRFCNNIVIENIIAGYTTYHKDLLAVNGFECDNLLINNFILANNTITHWEYNLLGMYFTSCNLVLRNSIIANNTAEDAWPFFYTNIYPGFEDYNLDMSNVLIMNNSIYNLGWVNNPIYMQNRFQRMQINNCTFANNTTNGTLSIIMGMADISNLISYNPEAYREIYLKNHLTTIDVSYEMSVRNSLFRTDSISHSLPELINFSENIMGSDPLFLGETDTSLSVEQPEYYQLSAGSPCINTGTADTSDLNLPPMDLAGNQRIWGGRIDMGCYEYDSEPYVSVEDSVMPTPVDKFQISVYPNPILNTSQAAGVFIEFALPVKSAEHPEIEIFNLRGQKVKSFKVCQSYDSLVHSAGLSGEIKQKGEFYSSVWNGKDNNNKALASGVYIVKVKADHLLSSTKITIVK